MAPLTREEVAKHTSDEGLWTIVDHKVYDVSDFQDAHPGGSVVLRQFAGKDATQAFYNLHRHEVLEQYSKLCVGTIEGETPEVIDPQVGDLSSVPYGEALWLTPQFTSPYYNSAHRSLRKAMRTFVETHIKPEAQEKEESGEYISQELIDKMAEANILAMRMGPGKHLHNRKLLDGAIDGKDFDFFSDLIINQELVRANARGFQDGNMAGMSISLSVIIQWANDEELKKRVTEEVFSGQKKICLAVTEAFAGSDVAGIQTTAKLSDDGSHYIVNGTKKWISNAVWSDYFVTGCRTDGGFSVLLVEKQEGVNTRTIRTSYSAAAATSFIEFDNVKVPAKNLLGKEKQGFTVIMSNFNHERWMIVCWVCQWNRTVLEECLKWTNQRMVFGKPLVSQPVIRQKLARMITLVESAQAWLEQITYQMNHMSYQDQAKHLSGPIALLKTYSTRCSQEIADDATNMFGGRGLTATGMGKVIEHFQRVYKFDAILGGAEEVMNDLGVRQAMRFMPNSKL
ncbi:acyl-CoA dehydrogenase [Neohortaea acidophila]|uniref:Acyl-CoA dehydrogenase n=1 Tax=Neohortaea acidophila TaxID=245834 RepID=A0A6A6PQJ8_9PEZI|nr:acyl-CoA dehydrogenase [Neohortaea acidophila]KAF2482215.1 acyl-CoA dehydrogenase [Neohortaea acidophila]